ncbi:putative aminodeoxychorismate lyase [Hypsizygus marmoreus]|uniref:Aminodeoxychorismate lyase n=1 Tax=Hypsizygus marmoreus TaxID=39966 RepID=A0A369K5Y6_HYPMA|nr:putative aminodeoxychorismate lyase [Hypsizygus marmoreus]
MSSSPNSELHLLASTRFDPLLSTLKWNNDHDGPSQYLLLPYHLDRLVDAAGLHGWEKAKACLNYEALKSTCHRAVTDYLAQSEAALAVKIRVIVSESGELKASVSPTTPFPADPTSASFFNPLSDNSTLFGPVFALHMDSQYSPTSLFTSTKTTERSVYNDARTRAGLPIIPTPSILADVLMYNAQNLITETSIFNVAFYRTPYWITPSASTGCLPGVLRRWLLEQGRIHEAKDNSLTKDNIREGDWVLLFNGVQGCRLGRIANFGYT